MNNMATQKNDLTTEQDGASLIAIGDQAIPIPYALLLSKNHSPLDVRLWCSMRIFYEEKRALSLSDYTDLLDSTTEQLEESLAILDMSGWLVVVYQDGNPTQPQLCAQQLNWEQIQSHNPGFIESLERYKTDGTERVSNMAVKILEQLQTERR